MGYRNVAFAIGTTALVTMSVGVGVAATAPRFDGTDGHRGVMTCYAKHGGALRVVRPRAGCNAGEGQLHLALDPVLATARQRRAVSAPQFSTQPREVRAVSVMVTVPRGHVYELAVAASAVIRQVAAGKCTNYGPGGGSSTTLSARLDGHPYSLLGLIDDGVPELPAGNQVSSTMLPVRAGRHTLDISMLPTECRSIASPGEYEESNALLAVDFVADIT